MLLEGPKLLAGTLAALNDERRNRVQTVGRDCARAVTGYMAGNLVISVICGVLTFIALKVAGVPFRALRGLFRFPARDAVEDAYRALGPSPRLPCPCGRTA